MQEKSLITWTLLLNTSSPSLLSLLSLGSHTQDPFCQETRGSVGWGGERRSTQPGRGGKKTSWETLGNHPSTPANTPTSPSSSHTQVYTHIHTPHPSPSGSYFLTRHKYPTIRKKKKVFLPLWEARQGFQRKSSKAVREPRRREASRWPTGRATKLRPR